VLWLGRVSALILALCLAARQGAAQAAAGKTTAPAGTTAAGTPAAGKTTAPAGTTAAAVGKGLYVKYCQLCHGVGGKGYAADNAPSLVSPMFLCGASDAFIASGIRFGRPETSTLLVGGAQGGPLACRACRSTHLSSS